MSYDIFFQLAEQGGGMFGPHGVPGGAAPSKLEAETQEQYNVAGGILNNTSIIFHLTCNNNQ